MQVSEIDNEVILRGDILRFESMLDWDGSSSFAKPFHNDGTWAHFDGTHACIRGLHGNDMTTCDQELERKCSQGECTLTLHLPGKRHGETVVADSFKAYADSIGGWKTNMVGCGDLDEYPKNLNFGFCGYISNEDVPFAKPDYMCLVQQGRNSHIDHNRWFMISPTLTASCRDENVLYNLRRKTTSTH